MRGNERGYNVNLKRLPGENLKDYKIRLCRNKDEYGISFQDIAALMSEETGEVKGESVYRKWWTYYKEGYTDAEKNLLLVKGAVPGPKKCLVTIKETVKAV